MTLSSENLKVRTRLLNKIIEVERARPELFEIAQPLQTKKDSGKVVVFLPNWLPLERFTVHVNNAIAVAKHIKEHLTAAEESSAPEPWLRELRELHARAKSNLNFAVEGHKARRELER